MKCAKCPLYSCWNNESDKGEACGLFGDSWDSQLQYEGKAGNIEGCYIDRHFIEKVDREYEEHLEREAASWEAWMLETDKERNDETCILM